MTGRGFPKPQRFSDCSSLRRVGPQPFPPGTLSSGHRCASLRSRVCMCSLAAGYIEVGVEADPPCDRELGVGLSAGVDAAGEPRAPRLRRMSVALGLTQ